MSVAHLRFIFDVKLSFKFIMYQIKRTILWILNLFPLQLSVFVSLIVSSIALHVVRLISMPSPSVSGDAYR